MKRLHHIALVLLAAGSVSCSIKNDMQLPKIPAEITSFEIEGQVSSRIDASNLSVNVVLGEEVRADKLIIRTVKISDGAKCTDAGFTDGGIIDLSSPYKVTLSNFREYEWTITSEQPVERYVKCENQVGESTIFPETRKVSIKVKKAAGSAVDSRAKLVITDMKLGLKGSRVVSTTDFNGNVQEISSFPVTLDCFYERKFTVDEEGKTSEWTLIALTD